MNKISLLLVAFAVQLNFAQNTFPSIGNVGIGTLTPNQALDVKGNGIFRGGIISDISNTIGGYIKLVNSSKTLSGEAKDWTIFNMGGNYGNSLQFWAYDNLACNGGLCGSRFTIMDNGNVGIGNNNPTNRLDVNGTIHSKEVKVDMLGWSDFVLKKEYNLPTLEEVEKHINEKGHLENIPSEEEVLKNGISLGEMNAKLLQKIEELTLYAIEQQKNTEALHLYVKEQEKSSDQLYIYLKKQNERLQKLEKENKILRRK